MRNPVYANIISAAVIRLFKEFPEKTIAEHTVIALDGQELYQLSDEAYASALSTYLIELEINQDDR